MFFEFTILSVQLRGFCIWLSFCASCIICIFNFVLLLLFLFAFEYCSPSQILNSVLNKLTSSSLFSLLLFCSCSCVCSLETFSPLLSISSLFSLCKSMMSFSSLRLVLASLSKSLSIHRSGTSFLRVMQDSHVKFQVRFFSLTVGCISSEANQSTQNSGSYHYRIIIVIFPPRNRLFIFRLTILHFISVITFHKTFTVAGVFINFIFVPACYRG